MPPDSPGRRLAAESTQFSEAPAAKERSGQITQHIERHLGPITNSFRETAGDAARIEVHFVAATKTRPVHTLITAGMSDVPMSVPENAESPRYLELMVTLPQSWKLDDQSAAQPEWNWPIRQLRSLAAHPRKFSTWLGWGHVVPNGDPPEPLAPNTKLCGAIIVPSLLVPTDFYELKTGMETIAFYSVVPLYREEMEMKSRDGMEPLLAKMVDRGITDLIDPKRRNAAVRKRFGLF